MKNTFAWLEISSIYKAFAALAPLLLACALCGCATFRGAPPKELFDNFKPVNKIDELALAKMRERNTPPSETCSDEVFLRRVYLDVTGTIPQADEARAFLPDKDPKKREKLIDKLLASPEFADYSALRWGDVLKVKSEFPSNLWPQGAYVYHRWIRDSVIRNMPYDQFVREMLTSSGSNFTSPPVNFYRAFQERAPKAMAENVALVFMGVRLNEPPFTEQQTMGMAAFFAKVGYKNTDEWKEEIVFFNHSGKLADPKTKEVIRPVLLDGKAVDIPPDKDPRAVLTDWLVSPSNPWFARNIANRVWFWLNGRGLVPCPDNLNAPRKAWSEELLAFLEKELVRSKYDLRHLHRMILTSRTYQLSSKTNRWNEDDHDGFSHYQLRRLDAEPLIDAICQVTGTRERYTSNIPEPYTVLPTENRAVAIADGSIDSPFLEMFGKSPRNSSYDEERSNAPSTMQAQHMLNSSHINRKIEQGQTLKRLVAAKKPNSWVAEELYLAILSRLPTEREKKTAEEFMSANKKSQQEAACDLMWALLNSREFILRH